MAEPKPEVPNVGELVRHLDDRFPFSWAESWDRVGLLVGDPDAEVSRVFVSLDASAEALSLAAAHGANVLVTHHPAFLESPALLTPATAGVAYQAISLGIALVACHTNLDRAPAGADALPRAIGLTPEGPLERSGQRAALVTVFVPDTDANPVLDAMSRAGGGRIGEYRGCAFSALGVGSFVPGEGANPTVGTVGERSSAEEVRLEMVCDPGVVPAVTAAARGEHPYEEPLIVVSDIRIDRGEARLGRLCPLREAVPLRALVDRVSDTLSIAPRVWGDPEMPVKLVATCSGSASSLIGDAVAAGASVLLTGEVRYHTALEALDAGLAIIEAGHDVTEWPHVQVLAGALRLHPALADRIVADEPTRHWWTP